MLRASPVPTARPGGNSSLIPAPDLGRKWLAHSPADRKQWTGLQTWHTAGLTSTRHLPWPPPANDSAPTPVLKPVSSRVLLYRPPQPSEKGQHLPSTQKPTSMAPKPQNAHQRARHSCLPRVLLEVKGPYGIINVTFVWRMWGWVAELGLFTTGPVGA